MLHDCLHRVRTRTGRIGFGRPLGAVLFGVAVLASHGVVPGVAAAATPSCSWQEQFGLGGSDELAPDSDAAYWVNKYLQVSGTGLTITGSFPDARYMSFAVYVNEAVPTGGSLYDSEIQPSSGVNPFQVGVDGTGGYTLHVVTGAQPAQPAPDTLYTGTTGAATVDLVYRVYDPIEPPSGGVALPQITNTFDGVPTTVHGACVTSTSAASGPERLELSASGRTPLSATQARAPSASEPVWEDATLAAYYPNPDNAYVGASINSADGQLVVIQAQMPAFPDTNAGAPPWQSGQQVRYWSICQNGGVVATVIGCVPDFEAVETAGVATFVISSPSNRPPNATAADGVNWLPWGSYADATVIYRQMLAAPTFSQAIPQVTGGTSLASTMGTYLPEIAYCSEATFAASGASGCLANSA